MMSHKALGFFAFAVLILSAARCVAFDETPAAKPTSSDAQAAAQAPAAKAEEKPAAKADEKSAAKADEKAPEPPKPAAEPAKAAAPESAPAAPKPLESCAAKIEPVAQAYQQAHDGLLSWLRAASDKMEAADQRIAELKSQIGDKEGAITKLKLESAAGASVAELQKQDQALWTQLKAEQSKRAELCRALARAAKQKVRELNQSVLDAAGKIEP